jgi:hypothetical protein
VICSRLEIQYPGHVKRPLQRVGFVMLTIQHVPDDGADPTGILDVGLYCISIGTDDAAPPAFFQRPSNLTAAISVARVGFASPSLEKEA